MGQRVEEGAWVHLLLLWCPRLDLPISTNGAKGRGRREVDRDNWSPPSPSFISGADVGCMHPEWGISGGEKSSMSGLRGFWDGVAHPVRRGRAIVPISRR